jgi:hypothetical protein
MLLSKMNTTRYGPPPGPPPHSYVISYRVSNVLLYFLCSYGPPQGPPPVQSSTYPGQQYRQEYQHPQSQVGRPGQHGPPPPLSVFCFFNQSQLSLLTFVGQWKSSVCTSWLMRSPFLAFIPRETKCIPLQLALLGLLQSSNTTAPNSRM